MTRQEALFTLLTQNDELSLQHRGYRYTQTRKGDADLQKRALGIAYVERRRHEYGKDISCVVSLRRAPIQLVRKIA